MSCSRLLAALAALAALGASAAAQTVISGNVSDGAGGPLLSGVVYHVAGTVTVPSGATLTIQPGAIVKLGAGGAFNVDGTLLAGGTTGQPVVVTSLRDDSAGGDTNGDGPSSGAPGDWVHLQFQPSASASVLQNVTVRFGGGGGWNAVRLSDCAATFRECTVEEGQNSAFNLVNGTAQPTIADCTIRNNSGWAIEGARFESVLNFSNNTATGNGADSVLLNTSTLAADAVVHARCGINGVLTLLTTANIPGGRTLSLRRGVVLKFLQNSSFSVSGVLDCQGTAGQPVVITSFADDAFGGDTNKDGPSSGAPGSWSMVRFNAGSSGSTLTNTRLRFGGSGGWSPIRVEDASPTLTTCTVEHAAGAGVVLASTAGAPSIQGCTVRNNAGWAVQAQGFESIVNLANNTATGNGANGLLLMSSTPGADLVIGPQMGFSNTLCLVTTFALNAGRTLTLQAGAILKPVQNIAYEISGTLITNGTPAQPVVLTSFADDQYGGDTNNDGASAGAPGAWSMLRFHAGSSASTLSGALLRFGGAGGWSPLRVEAASPTITGCTIEHAAGTGILLADVAGAPTIQGCTVRNNAGWAVQAQGFESIVNLSGNTATANGVNGLLLLTSSPSTDLVIGPQMGFSNTLCLLTTFNLAAGRTFTLQAGAILKPVQNIAYEISGALIANGGAAQPVVFTSFSDDEHGGDTNNDGQSFGSAGQWTHLRFHPTSSGSRLRNALIRHGGAGGWNPIYIQGGSPTIEHCTIERGANAGISLANTPTQARIDDCTVRDCTGAAITSVPVDSLPFITRFKASGNGANQVQVTTGSLAGDLYLDGNMGLNGAVVMHTTLTVPVGRKLTLGPGAIFKLMSGQRVDVLGAMDVIATRERPAVITASSDDSVGGDSDGAGSPPGAGHWIWLLIDSNAAPSRIENLLLRYGGQGGWTALRANSPLAEYRHVRVERAAATGFDLAGAARADFLTAWSCGATGIALSGGGFALERATAANCATGIARTGAWNGLMRSSIAWGNTSANVAGFLPNQASFCDGIPGGANFNLDVSPQFVNALTGDLRLLGSSPCINAGDPAAAKDADCTRADMGSAPSDAAPTLYCAGKLNSFGCTPYLGYSGFARARVSDPLVVRCFDVLSNKQGLFFYGFSGRANSPFQGGLKCVADPVRRTALQNSGGLGSFVNCGGVFALDFSALASSGVDPMLVPGASVNVQSWHRDPGSPSNTGLSNALEFTLCN